MFVSKLEVGIQLSMLNLRPLQQLKHIWNPYIALYCIA